jgi:protein involved in polysaccharide export with SLBB domain
MRYAYLTCSTSLLLAALAGCATSHQKSSPTYAPLTPHANVISNISTITVKTPLNPALLRPDGTPFTFGPGDSLDIEIVGTPTSRATAKVGPDGKIYYNLLPGLDVWGLTLAQAREAIEREMGKYLTQPKVSVNLRTVGSKYIWLLGRLTKPGLYATAGGMSLLEALSMAGGTSHSTSQSTSVEEADLRHSFVVRQGQFLPVDFHKLLREGDLSQNIMLEADDFVFIRSALEQEVYVLGAVKGPRAIQYVEDMTLVSAMANGSGPIKLYWGQNGDNGTATKDAYLSHVAIVRGSLAEPQVAVVDYGAVVKGKAADVRLEPGDIIYVPNQPFTTIKRYMNLILNSFVSTVAANEGIRAGGGTTGVGVTTTVNTGSK